jgi:hypothetical protein
LEAFRDAGGIPVENEIMGQIKNYNLLVDLNHG